MQRNYKDCKMIFFACSFFVVLSMMLRTSQALHTPLLPDWTVLVDDVEFVPLYDVPHLLKCMRNNFMSKDIEIDFDRPNLKEEDRKFASWEHIVTAYEVDVYSSFLERHIPDITEQHVYLEKMNKMRVKLMMQVFSRKMSRFVDLLARSNEFTHGDTNFDSMMTDEELDSDQVPKQQITSEDDLLGTNNRTKEEQAVYLIEFETEPDEKEEVPRKRGKDGTVVIGESQSPLDPWSIVWYIGSFGGLVAFFLIVSCSEWCCRRGARPMTVPYIQRGEVINGAQGVTETPPPPYHLFAPPPYDSINYADLTDKASGEKLDIYVISVPIQSPVNQVPA